MEDEFYMKKALELARIAYDNDEVPVGAVVVKDGEIVGEGYNLRQTDGIATYHAEIVAIENACKKIGNWRLSGCTLYVTLEPCPMCAGAIINSRLDRVVYGIEDPKAGCFGSVINFNSYPFNHFVKTESGVLGDKCSDILNKFFKKKRKNKITAD